MDKMSMGIRLCKYFLWIIFFVNFLFYNNNVIADMLQLATDI